MAPQEPRYNRSPVKKKTERRSVVLATALLIAGILIGCSSSPSRSEAGRTRPDRERERDPESPTSHEASARPSERHAASATRKPSPAETPPPPEDPPAGKAPSTSEPAPRAPARVETGPRAATEAEREPRPPPSSGQEAARGFVERLRRSPEDAEAAMRELWEVEARWIPDLILEVDNPQPSKVRELKVLVVDRDSFARKNVGLDARGENFTYWIPGMGELEYDSIAVGPARSGKSLKIVLKRSATSAPFSVGMAVRAALLNRFASSDYPSRADLLGWWQEYYERVRSSL